MIAIEVVWLTGNLLRSDRQHSAGHLSSNFSKFRLIRLLLVANPTGTAYQFISSLQRVWIVRLAANTADRS